MHSLLSFFARRSKRLKLVAHFNLINSIIKSSLLLTALFALHIFLMMHYEGLSAGDASWLTFTTATTVGYGDISAATTEGRLATILLLYLGGIFILARVVGDYFDYRMEVRDKKTKGLWSWKMNNHIVILNTPSFSGERYLQRLIKQFRCSTHYEDTTIYLLSRQFPNGLPDFITELDNVVHYHGNASNPDDLAAVCIDKASEIIVLTKDENDESSDGRTFDILHRLNDLNIDARVLAECVEDSNRKRLQAAGANILIRPIRAYPEMIVRAFVAPDSERIIENMFNSEDDEYRRFDIELSGLSWSDIVTRLISHNVGIAVAYIDRKTSEMVYNPAADTIPDGQALITISKDKNKFSNDDVKKLCLSEGSLGDSNDK
ncbi:MAG: potassium channel protein [Gammaproteobacteria bacterium]|jgi:voltage-gated potassium channel|nr:potassium channel protein [Gammaproteobacteria bacterium]MBT3723128.1 potassium channel protein [Gammaproteobacteria bacterium]MBT4077222.1 potassium channel protein [Gammaproteobacteria bacterium]MBT4192723.1 potassium channel protein [Gammaproteobacteria bacterium]MBT4451732.1 potassium channel protein [Gammaproteobacteria bacterium]